MTSRATISLWEALTKLTFDDPIPATAILNALSERRWGCSRLVAQMRFATAVQALCDACYKGEVALWAKLISVQSSAAMPHQIDLGRVTESQCLEYRLVIPGYDTLFKGENKDAEYGDSFEALANGLALDDVRVDFTAISLLIARRNENCTSAVTAPYTTPEIDTWIKATHYTGMKKARNEFMKDPRAKGLSATFEFRWKGIKKKSVGRPKIR